MSPPCRNSRISSPGGQRVAIARTLGVEPDGVSLELNRFHRADAEALQEAGIAVRLSLPLPEKLAVLWQGGRGPLSTIRRCLRE
jgi:glycerophosphoryl diester phosphodiesterase